ncbi:hypothetical protein [Amycolatopsis sp. H20-H5]|nr:hypothetical protein [Amycolatopsis sp. H20-H5]MEC3973868.1 hypothetical protein [Amycolatopsis sp. H20-H5]
MLVRELVEAARGDDAGKDLERVATTALRAGVEREDILKACNDAL